MTLTEALYKGWRECKLAYGMRFDSEGKRCLLGMLSYGFGDSSESIEFARFEHRWLFRAVQAPCGCTPLEDPHGYLGSTQWLEPRVQSVIRVIAHLSNEHLYKGDPNWTFEKVAGWFEGLEKQFTAQVPGTEKQELLETVESLG